MSTCLNGADNSGNNWKPENQNTPRKKLSLRMRSITLRVNMKGIVKYTRLVYLNSKQPKEKARKRPFFHTKFKNQYSKN